MSWKIKDEKKEPKEVNPLAKIVYLRVEVGEYQFDWTLEDAREIYNLLLPYFKPDTGYQSLPSITWTVASNNMSNPSTPTEILTTTEKPTVSSSYTDTKTSITNSSGTYSTFYYQVLPKDINQVEKIILEDSSGNKFSFTVEEAKALFTILRDILEPRTNREEELEEELEKLRDITEKNNPNPIWVTTTGSDNYKVYCTKS